MAKPPRELLGKSKEELASQVLKLEEELKTANSRLRREDKYGLYWVNKDEDFDEQARESLPVITPKADKKFPDVITDASAVDHVLIEGDNYHALSVLNYTHREKVDVIYIDPPYNTGNDGFKYHDRRKAKEFPDGVLVPKDHPFRHSYWLSFMAKRLKLARELLKETGVIFISIDDNEVAQLRLLCDEIFKEENRIDRGMIIWNNAGSTKGFRNIVKNHEYILGYGKSASLVKNYFGENFPNNLGFVEGRLQIKRTNRNPVSQIKFPKGLPIEGAEDLVLSGPINPGTNQIDIIGRETIRFINGKLSHDVVLEASFPYKDQVEEFFSKGGSNEKTYDEKGQEYVSIFFTKTGVPYYRKSRNTIMLSSVLSDLPNSGLMEYSSILENGFDNPKPSQLIKTLLEVFSAKESVVLDFFAGSGTTAHAVARLNAEDGGKRKCILVTNNENEIAEKVCYERVKRILSGYKNAKGEKVAGLGGNLRYLKTDFVPKYTDEASRKSRRVSDKSKLDLTHRAGYMLAMKENTFEEKAMTKNWQIFESTTKITAVYFREDKKHLDELAENLSKAKKPVKLYVFSWHRGEYKNAYSEYENIRCEDIPDPILEVYKNIGL